MRIYFVNCRECKLVIDLTFSKHKTDVLGIPVPGACPRCGSTKQFGPAKEGARPSIGVAPKYAEGAEICFWGLSV